jgi:predicted GH43/DUF377 family glycosyl hydrolase
MNKILPEDLPDLARALEGFDASPAELERILNLSKSFRHQGMHEMAMMFAIHGASMVSRDDALYYPLKAEIATSGYYSQRPDMREMGHIACEEMALARDCHPAARHISFQNLFHYTKKLSDYAPSFRAVRIEFDVPDGYYPTNPSICRLHNQMFMNVRCVNYYTDFDEKIIHPVGEPLRTRNFLLGVDRDISRQGRCGEILPPADLPRLNTDQPLGVEDVRLFPYHGELWTSGTVVQTNAEQRADILVARIPHMQMCDWKIRQNKRAPRHQKNWAPVIGGAVMKYALPTFIYSYDPFHLYEDGLCLGAPQPPIAAHTWSGSTQAIPYYEGYLVMIHEKTYQPDMTVTRRWYQQRFAWYDTRWNLRKISRRFQFDNGETEFPCGMCVHPDGRRLVISYGVLDREAWLAIITLDEVWSMLYDVG